MSLHGSVRLLAFLAAVFVAVPIAFWLGPYACLFPFLMGLWYLRESDNGQRLARIAPRYWWFLFGGTVFVVAATVMSLIAAPKMSPAVLQVVGGGLLVVYVVVALAIIGAWIVDVGPRIEQKHMQGGSSEGTVATQEGESGDA